MPIWQLLHFLANKESLEIKFILIVHINKYYY